MQAPGLPTPSPSLPQQQQQQQQHHGRAPSGPPAGPTECRECRRRRVKCDGTMPECMVCQRYRRHCLYDKHSRTRLTRKQLTILEERLEKAESILRSYFTETQLAEMMDGTAAMRPALAEAPSTVATPALLSSQSSSSNPAAASAFTPGGMLPVGFPGGVVPSPTQLGSGLAEADSLDAFALASSVADNFDWDETDHSWNASDWAADAGGEAESPQAAIMDGMASLSVGERRGFLGSVSGAAMLRQILSARRDQGTRGGGPDHPNSGGGTDGSTAGGNDDGGNKLADEVSPQHLESLLLQQPPEHASQWVRNQAMLTRLTVERLVDAFFALYHPTFPIVHEPTFRAQHAGALPRPGRDGWHALANILVALGSFAGSNCADATDLPVFRSAQRVLFADSLEAGNLTLVQAFGLSATYLQKRNRPNTGYNYGGIALRMGIGLGLHKEFQEGGRISPLQMEIRRRVWWTLCVLDVGATISYGRPLNWPQAGVEAALPKNIHEKDLIADSAPCPPEVEGLTLYTYLRVQSSYHLQTMGIYNRLIHGPFPGATELAALDDEGIGAWLAQMPDYYSAFPPAGSVFALGLGITKWRYRNLRIVMYRPFLVRWALGASPCDRQHAATPEDAAVFKCLDAASETIASIHEFWTSRSHSRLAAWYVLYFLFHATMIPVHSLRHNPGHSHAPDWRSQVHSSLAVMEAMSDLSPNSSKCREICLTLCRQQLHEETAMSDAPAPEGSQQVNGMGAPNPFTPGLPEGDAANALDGYDAWCQLMSNTSGGMPMYQWPNIEDQHLDFFSGVNNGFGS